MSKKEVQAQRLQTFLEAEQKALKAQSFKDGKVEVTRANLSSISSGVDSLVSSGAADDDESLGGVRRVVMRDY